MKRLLLSFKNAFRGLGYLIANEHNAKIHAFATAVVIIAGFWFRINPVEWTLILIAVLLVWAAEAVNTAIEHLANVVSPGSNPQIKIVKDVSAGAVLLASIVAVLIGWMVFGPYFLGI